MAPRKRTIENAEAPVLLSAEERERLSEQLDLQTKALSKHLRFLQIPAERRGVSDERILEHLDETLAKIEGYTG